MQNEVAEVRALPHSLRTPEAWTSQEWHSGPLTLQSHMKPQAMCGNNL